MRKPAACLIALLALTGFTATFALQPAHHNAAHTHVPETVPPGCCTPSVQYCKDCNAWRLNPARFPRAPKTWRTDTNIFSQVAIESQRYAPATSLPSR